VDNIVDNADDGPGLSADIGIFDGLIKKYTRAKNVNKYNDLMNFAAVKCAPLHVPTAQTSTAGKL